MDFVNVSTVGLESSPVAAALAGLRANEARGRIQALRRDGDPRRARLIQVRQTEVEAGRDHSRLVFRDQGRLLSPTGPDPSPRALGRRNSVLDLDRARERGVGRSSWIRTTWMTLNHTVKDT